VLALVVLEHLDVDAAGLREAARLARPGGWLLVTVPALPSLWGSQDAVSQHRRRFTRGTLLRTFARARLPAPRATYFNTFLLPPVAGVRLARRMLGLAERPRSDFDDNRPGWLNELLSAVFAAERHLVARLGLPVGVSLLATLRMERSV
jgi:SAM-dependent methyltransferase